MLKPTRQTPVGRCGCVGDTTLTTPADPTANRIGYQQLRAKPLQKGGGGTLTPSRGESISVFTGSRADASSGVFGRRSFATRMTTGQSQPRRPRSTSCAHRFDRRFDRDTPRFDVEVKSQTARRQRVFDPFDLFDQYLIRGYTRARRSLARSSCIVSLSTPQLRCGQIGQMGKPPSAVCRFSFDRTPGLEVKRSVKSVPEVGQ